MRVRVGVVALRMHNCSGTYWTGLTCLSTKHRPVRFQRLPVIRVIRSSSANPMAPIPLARIARQLAAQGNIKISKSGMNLSGQNSAASPNARPNWTTRHSPKLFMAMISNGMPFLLERDGGIEGKLRRLPLPESGLGNSETTGRGSLWKPSPISHTANPR